MLINYSLIYYIIFISIVFDYVGITEYLLYNVQYLRK